jgi:glyoxylase-like metal-dependent hydrolase (beta-lactamase superfamily II)
MIHRTFAILFCFVTATAARAQQDFSKVEIETTHVAGNVYVLRGEGGNIGVSAGPDGLLIVDDEFAPLAEKIEAALKRINPGPLKFVLNTHFHGDHTGANAHFGRQAPIIAQANVRKRLAGAVGGTRPEPKEGLPVVTFDDALFVHFNGEEIKVLHVPAGHTDGDSLIFFTKSNVVHMGDQFFSGRFPNIDLGGGGDVRGYVRNVELAIRTIPLDAKIIPGHGPLSTMKELKEFHAMLVGTVAHVERQIAAGKTLADVKSAGLPDEWKSWDQTPIRGDRWLDILYRGLSRPAAKPAAAAPGEAAPKP